MNMDFEHLGFTGTQEGMTTPQKDFVRSFLMLFAKHGSERWFHHGCCIGADEQAHFMAAVANLRLVGHPPVRKHKMAHGLKFDVTFLEQDYLERNHTIVGVTSAMLATPRSSYEEMRSGTWSTVRYAQKIGRPVTIVMPSGDLKFINKQENNSK